MSDKLLLRPLDFQPVKHQGQDMWLLRDPLQLTSYQLIMPLAMAQILMFLDGTRTAVQIHADFCQHVGQEVDFAIIEDALQQLDEACLLENQRAQDAYYNMLAEFRAQTERKPALAGLGYPNKPQELDDLFASYADGDAVNEDDEWHGRAIVSPHIDYQRGGPVYARVWRRARTAVLAADMVIIFGTDHNGGPSSITLTRLPYATPYGVLPTHRPMIDRLANAIGPDNAFTHELNHRQEHSVELSAVWLHHIYHRAHASPPPMIPILVGSFQHYLENGAHP
ncbi:MAG: AmmeMemoRadiSam system protein B, partial [Anaerolineae bacterium]